VKGGDKPLEGESTDDDVVTMVQIRMRDNIKCR
jgi:hypothetical protein